jgi:hypothetical protein
MSRTRSTLVSQTYRWLPLPFALIAVGCSSSAQTTSGDPASGFGQDGGPGSDSGTTHSGKPDAPGNTGSLQPTPDAAGSEVTSKACKTNADCDNHNPCEAFACTTVGGQELSQSYCTYTPIDGGSCGPTPPPAVDASTPTPDSGTPVIGQPPIDPLCMGGDASASIYPPYVPLVPPDVPADCANGFEIGDATSGSVYTLTTNQPGGSQAITLDVDFATYLEPDGVLITGVNANGTTYTLLDTCRLQTWSSGDPTGGTSRPPDETIRQFRIKVTAGTKSLKVDFAGVVSPMYIQVLGLCDFNVTTFASCTKWQAVP